MSGPGGDRMSDWSRIDPLLRAHIDWLVRHGEGWSQRQFYHWWRSFEACIHLLYPTPDEKRNAGE